MAKKSLNRLATSGLLKIDPEKIERTEAVLRKRAVLLRDQSFWNRDPKTYSDHVKRMRSVAHTAVGGDYLDDRHVVPRLQRAIRRAKRLGLDAGSIAGHIKRNARQVQHGGRS